MMNDAEKAAAGLQKIFAAVQPHFLALFDDTKGDDNYPNKRPLLAHYTSIETLERVLKTNQVWLSNPLFMDDFEELRFGLQEGHAQFNDSEDIRQACGSPERATLLSNAFNQFFTQFVNQHAVDVYVLCLSEHKKDDKDGILSMWRGYGGNGKGAAVVFDTAKFGANINSSPLIISKVEYLSAHERRAWLGAKLAQFAKILRDGNFPDSHLNCIAWILFQRIKTFALYTKHSGFFEEREWRVAYLKETDINKSLAGMLGYAIGRRGVEVKLMLTLTGIDGVTPPDLSLANVVSQIILGPSISSELAKAAVLRMLEKLGHEALKDRVISSSIPYRGLN